MKAWRPLAALALAGLCALQLLALLRTPVAWMPSRVTLTLARGAALELDSAMLGAARGSAPQLRLRRDLDGAWWLARSGAGSGFLALERDGVQRRSGSALLAAGQRFQLGAAAFTIDALDGRGATFSSQGTRWHYDGAMLLRDGALQASCPDARLGTRVAAAWNRIVPAPLTLARPLVFGGNLDCGNRIAVAGLAAPAATIARARDGLVLAAGADTLAPLLLAERDAATPPAPLAGREQRLDDAAALVTGRTRLLVERNGDLLHLQPASHVALYGDTQVRLAPGVGWEWTRRGLWQLPERAGVPAAIAAAALLGTAALLCAGRRRHRLRDLVPALTGAALAGCGLGLLWLQRSTGGPGTLPGAGISLLVAWGALWLALWAPRRLPLALGAGVLLLAVGLLAQLELGLGAPESSWLRYFQKTAAALALGVGGGAMLLALRPPRHGAPLPQARIEALLVLLAGAALAALLVQVVFGDETGVFDLQPVEFAKLALAALSAHCLALAAGAQPAPGSLWMRSLRLATPALLFMALLGVALVQVDDYSPLVLLGVWGGAMALAHALATRQRLAAVLLVAGAGGAVLAVAALRGAGPGEIAQWNFYADRFLVWLDPGTHPHTGQQLLLGARAVAEGGWRGADHLFGLAALGQDAGPARHIPAVQDDFAPSFFLNRHGLAAALGLWLLQAAFVGGLLAVALRCWQAQAGTRDFRRAWLARFRCFLLCGGAAFVSGHLLLSWGTNLAIFPVMGQPMSFLSAGGSHLLFFICPLLALTAASAQSLEET
ncbi:FtsW/RodA/SpoVE family cell cycle protein [Herbaspirillum sp. SJZ107]|uniref:FtsW/RodA/SpoVE family cell cycle protein n=1 Tax=Herbaspirillum sp. SJZ107 TaxID=2572881 RepID=UPI0011520177|nr:FtsW/RodA/SpoVE family cell cycle protein [Herbaspirillum sp. SJZ107]TQK11154.1 cell division protein FtsW [Herbaspirillum sp. SJZ107]